MKHSRIISADTEADLCHELIAGFDAREADAIQRAFAIARRARQQPCKPQGIAVASTLSHLGVDAVTLQAALLSDPGLRDIRRLDDINNQFGDAVANLVHNVDRLNTFNEYSQKVIATPEQAENLRRMLLAMVDDIRAVLIRLAYRVERLRLLPKQDNAEGLYLARETMEIYAPLANRLGVGHLKWELEDLAFRLLEPRTYKNLAKGLAENRLAREKYIHDFVLKLQQELDKQGINAKVYGRPKHIYSIWRKMQRKKLDLHDLYDLLAVRVLVDKIPTCYTVLGLVHSLWTYVPREFDDYIANPKENGYQSLHTVIVGPQGMKVEIQIRTTEMDNYAELGVAAHWRYKEGGKYSAAMEKRIASLRRLLEEREDGNLLEDFRTELYADRIFVLTPQGDLKELMKGATPIDFAYAIHTEIGHRCRGAKVNGHIVPLNYQLQSGEQVEILTSRESRPNRSWLNPNLGYLNTPHARGKVRHWFRKQDHEKNIRDGKAILDRIRQHLGLQKIALQQLRDSFRLARDEDVLIAIGRAEITSDQVINALESGDWRESELTALKPVRRSAPRSGSDQITVQGVGNLLTSFAQCCKPVPGDAIIGYITIGKGIVIHRQDCGNILQLPEEKQDHLIDVNWGSEPCYSEAQICVRAFDRRGLLNDITQMIANNRINILKANTRFDRTEQTITVTLTLEIVNIAQLGQLLDRIAQLRNVFEVRRVQAPGNAGQQP